MLTVETLKSLKVGDTVSYKGMRIVQDSKVLLDSPAGLATVKIVGMYGVSLALPNGDTATVVEADDKARSYYSV